MMTTPKHNVNLFGRQYDILQDWLNTDKHCMDICHAGAGKTFLASIALPIFASDYKYHKGKDIILVAPTSDMIRTNLWEPLKTICIEHYGLIDSKDINNSDLTIRMPQANGTYVMIRCKSAETKLKLRGMNAGIILADEASLFSEEVMQELINRLRPRVGSGDTPGRMIVISTPHGTGPLKDLFDTAKVSPKWVVRHYNYLEMRSGDKDFIENTAKKILSPLKFAQDYMVSWDSVSDQFFYAFEKHKHAGNVFDRGGDLIMLCDFNRRKHCWTVAQMHQGRLELVKAIAMEGYGTEQMCIHVREMYPRRNIAAVIDVSGGHQNKETQSRFGKTDKAIMLDYGFDILNGSKKANPLITDTDNSSNAAIAQGKLIVNDQDALLLDAMTTYHYEDATRLKLVKYTEAKYSHIDGLGDGIRYALHHFFPVRTTHHAESYVSDDGRRIRPGDKYRPESPLFPGGPTLKELIENGYEEGTGEYVEW